jgi:hypothetical protein
MSPEIFQNKPYSYKSDVWALGCVLYEMTTLNHAFDANSLNGLATKIVKGKYPPIHAKYSRYLRELIQQMLMINPQQRPDMDQILRKPFIKKHVINFFLDIASRPSASIGEGTMVFKAAAGGAVNGMVLNDSTMISLRQQLNALDMADAVSEAMRPKGNPQDDQEAIKFAREQASALKREQEHKKMVEAALEKLRQEREMRAKQRNDPRAVPQKAAPLPSARRDEPPKRPSPAPQYSPPPVQQQQQQQQQQQPANRLGNEAARRELLRENNSKDRLNNDRYGNDPAPAPAAGAAGGRRRTFGEEKESARERADRDNQLRERERLERERVDREKKAIEERRRLAQEQEAARARAAEDRRREEVRAEARAREEARLREEAKQREEQAERMRMEQVREKAELAARAKREAQREKERERQREEIEQLKRDKLELDRRTTEREKQREDRMREERQKIENSRREQMDVMQLKLDNMNDQIGKLEFGRPSHRAEEKGSDEYISARERVYLRRQEKQAKEEAERLEALREAEGDNRRIRSNAQQEGRSKAYGDHLQPRGRSSDPYGDEGETPRYEFDNRNRNKSNRMDQEELNDRLEEATRGKASRFESDGPSEKRQSGRGVPAETGKSSASSTQLGDEGSDSASEEELFHKADVNREEEEEDLHRREEELQAELNFATQRVEELKRTLQETKSFLGPRLPTRQGKETKAPAPAPVANPKDAMYEEEEDEEDLYELDENSEYEVTFEFF